LTFNLSQQFLACLSSAHTGLTYPYPEGASGARKRQPRHLPADIDICNISISIPRKLIIALFQCVDKIPPAFIYQEIRAVISQAISDIVSNISMMNQSEFTDPSLCAVRFILTLPGESGAGTSSPANQSEGRSHVRLMAIKALLMGFIDDQVAALYSISQRTLSRWVNEFNHFGIDGLIEGSRIGRPRKITPEQSAQYEDLIEHPEHVNRTHWTAKKFHGYLTKELEQEIGYRTVARWLHEQDFCLKVPRPCPNGQDEEKRKAHVRKHQYLSERPGNRPLVFG
jgi:transposase